MTNGTRVFVIGGDGRGAWTRRWKDLFAIAEDGVVADATLEALHTLKQSGRKLLLITGRQLPDLKNVLPEIALFDLIVAENGGLLFDPKTGEETLLSPQPPQVFLDTLRARGVPVSAGRCIVATWEPHQHAVLEAIRELGLELQIIFNKGAVMVLPNAERVLNR